MKNTKRIIGIFFILVICLSFSACGKSSDYKTALSMIEEGRYSEAKAIFETIPDYKDVAEYLTRYKTVEITDENWETYFKIDKEMHWKEENAFGEVEPDGFKHLLVFNEEYAKHFVSAKVDFGFNLVIEEYEIEYDGKNKTYQLVKDSLTEIKEPSETIVTYEKNGVAESLLLVDESGNFKKLEKTSVVSHHNFIFNRVQGTIEIFE